jgi:hypothetical protein
MMSSSQKEELHVNYSTPTSKDPPEGNTTAVIAVMRDKPNNSFHCHHSNQHYKRTLMQVLLDGGSDGDLVLVSKGKPMLLPYQKGWFHSCGIL